MKYVTVYKDSRCPLTCIVYDCESVSISDNVVQVLRFVKIVGDSNSGRYGTVPL